MPAVSNFRLVGVGTSVKLGKTGPMLVANGTQFDFRQSDGLTLTSIRGGTATDPNHLVTLTQLQTLGSSLTSTLLACNGSANALTITPTGGINGNLVDFLASYATLSQLVGLVDATSSDISLKLDANGSANALTVTPTGGTSGKLTDILANSATITQLVAVMDATTSDLSNKLDANGSANSLTVTPTGGSTGNLVDILGNAALKTDLITMMNAAVVDLSNKIDANGDASAATVLAPGGTVKTLANAIAALDTTSTAFQGTLGTILGALTSVTFAGPVSFTANVGFNGSVPVAKQTLAAALVTDGSATNAQICNAFNAIRTALITLGLAQ